MDAKTAKKLSTVAKLKPKRNPKLKLFQKDKETFGTIDDKTFIAIPDVLLGAIALANGKHTLDDIAFHLVKNTAMSKEEMLARLSTAFDLMQKNGFVTIAGKRK